MFFIGIFGIQNKNEQIGTESAVICPVCERYGRFEIVKSYYYFHIFFIPVWRWNKRYYIQTHCCKRICELDQETGSKIEAGHSIVIEKEHIHRSEQPTISVCPSCSTQVDPSFHYCPYCGSQINS
ncbi:MAG TPA: zinc ribbon domain-containing protein [Firmicutes bacterium]|nr:zinc ribbon domain-containing protein [Bacillota bacterium]